jgi:hypothetical protein
LLISDLIRNTIRYTSVTSVTLLIINLLRPMTRRGPPRLETRKQELEARACALKTGNIGYTPHYQQLNWQHFGNTSATHRLHD